MRERCTDEQQQLTLCAVEHDEGAQEGERYKRYLRCGVSTQECLKMERRDRMQIEEVIAFDAVIVQ